MTQQSVVLGDKRYTPCLNHGFVGLIDSMGNDAAIVQAARVSYGDGTKSVSADQGLINYLLRHLHTTPFEMVEFKFHCKMPIFVARQWVRHRTASVNEYSGRYSIMVDEFYVPELEHILPQSEINNQGRGGEMSLYDKVKVQDEIITSNVECYDRYLNLLNEGSPTIGRFFSDDFEGLSREMARGVLSVNNYTEWYWKINLHNLFHFLVLRMDDHAQYEIRVFASAMYDLIKPIVPLASEAFEKYSLNSERFSSFEIAALKKALELEPSHKFMLAKCAEEVGLKGRELREFKEKFDLD